MTENTDPTFLPIIERFRIPWEDHKLELVEFRQKKNDHFIHFKYECKDAKIKEHSLKIWFKKARFVVDELDEKSDRR